jgi:Domain of unknown function (DUF4270)
MIKKITLNALLRKVTLLSAIFFILTFVSCKKDGELIPEFDRSNVNVLFTDTVSLITSLEREDSLRTDLSIYNLLGIINDPVFGPRSASIYSQVTLNGLGVTFGATPVLDSIVLTLKYAGTYGDVSTAAPMQIDVYELNASMDVNTDYYSNTILLTPTPTLLASVSYIPNLNDSVYVLSDSIAPHLRINLGNTFGQTIINPLTYANLATNTAFTGFMKGLYITPNETVGATSLASGAGFISYFDINSDVSTVTMYYDDTSSYSFIMNSESAKYSFFDANYTGTDVEKQLTNSPTKDSTLMYVSAMVGVKTKIEIPHIRNLADDGTVIVNKAELVISIEVSSDGTFDAIPSLAVVGIDANGETVFLPDFFEGLDHYGGQLDGTTKTYTFNISRHIHDLLYKYPIDYGLYLLSTSNSITANRSVIGSAKNPLAKMKLNITYSKL